MTTFALHPRRAVAFSEENLCSCTKASELDNPHRHEYEPDNGCPDEIVKAHFDPHQPRDWHGRWIHLPGASKYKSLLVRADHNGFHVHKDNSTGEKSHVKTFKTQRGADSFVAREIAKDKTDKKAYKQAAATAAQRATEKEKHNRYLEQKAQRERAASVGITPGEKAPAPKRSISRRTKATRVQVSETERAAVPGTASDSQINEAQGWARKEFIDNTEYKYSGLVLRLLKKGVTQDPKRRGDIHDKYGISPKRQAEIESAIYSRIFPSKVTTPRQRDLSGGAGRLPSAQRKALQEQGAIRAVPLPNPEYINKPERLFKATKGKNRGKWVVTKPNGESRVVSDKQADSILKKSRDYWTKKNAEMDAVNRRRMEARRKEQTALLEEELHNKQMTKAQKIAAAQKWADSMGLDKTDSYWWGFYWQDPSLISASQKLGQDEKTTTPLNVNLPAPKSRRKSDPTNIERILALPDIGAHEMRGHRPRGKKPMKGDPGFVPAGPEARRTGAVQESRNIDRQIRHDRRKEISAYRAYLQAHPRSTMKFATFQKKYRKGTIAKKHEQPAGYVAESLKIKQNKLIYGDKVHKFKAAKWTHPNGHPRCLLCGDEESISPECNRMPTQAESDEFDRKLAAGEWPVSKRGFDVHEPRDFHGRWTKVGSAFRAMVDSTDLPGERRQHTGMAVARRAGAALTPGAKKTAFKNGVLVAEKKRLPRGGLHVMEDINGKPMQRRKLTPEEALTLRNTGKTAISNQRLKEIWEGKAPTALEKDLIVSAGGQQHIDGDTENIRTRLKSGHDTIKSRQQLITAIRSQWAAGSGDRSHKRQGISEEARARAAAKRTHMNKLNSAEQARKVKETGELFSLDNKTCLCIFCGKPVKISAMSLEKGNPKGKYEKGNMFPAHKSCNEKANKLVQSMGAEAYHAEMMKRFKRVYPPSVKKYLSTVYAKNRKHLGTFKAAQERKFR